MSLLLGRDFYFEVVKGNVPGHNEILKWGRNPDIDTASGFEAIWNGGGPYTGFDAVAEDTAEILSADVDDAGTLVDSGTATGGTATTLVDSGADFTLTTTVGDLVIDDTQLIHGTVTARTATTITVFQWQDITEEQKADGVVGPDSSSVYRVVTPASTGAAAIKLMLALDGNYASQQEYIILNGTTVVESVKNYLRTSRAIVLLAGSSGTNEGEITVRQKTDNAVKWIGMPATEGRTTICAYTIPAGKNAFFKHWGGALATKKVAASVLKLMMRPVGQPFQLLDVQAINSTGTSANHRMFPIPKNALMARSDVVVEADSNINDNAVSAHFDLVLEDE